MTVEQQLQFRSLLAPLVLADIYEQRLRHGTADVVPESRGFRAIDLAQGGAQQAVKE
ncbi:hypothetical protein GmRootV15_68870 (plasmid) [Variovorax sp. V15]